MVFHGEHDRRFDQASLAIFLRPSLGLIVLLRGRRGNPSCFVNEQAFTPSIASPLFSPPWTGRKISMRGRGKICCDQTQARRHPASLPRAELPEEEGGRHGTEI